MKPSVRRLSNLSQAAQEMHEAYGSQTKVSAISGIAQPAFQRIYHGTRTNISLPIYLLLLKAFLRLKSGFTLGKEE